jgi:formylglycine-generating enzyme required for sulfatase activity
MKAATLILVMSCLILEILAQATPQRVLDLQIETAPGGLVYLTWQEDPAASSYKVYLSDRPRPYGDPAWLQIGVAYTGFFAFSASPSSSFFYVAPVYDDWGTLSYVSGGTFFNGTSNVTVSSFYLDKYEVTQASYHAVMNSNPSHDNGVGDNFPVYYVNWFNAIEYCNRRSLSEGLIPCYSYSSYGTDPDAWPTGWNLLNANHLNIACNWSAQGYRLPTEMEWMFAARGGNQTHGYTYSGSNDIDSVAWYDVNANETHEAGTKAGNELSLFDLSGNVREWCWDISANYPTGDQTDPTGPATGVTRVKRGGSFWDAAAGCAVTYRSGNTPDVIHQNSGFRVCRRVPN